MHGLDMPLVAGAKLLQPCKALELLAVISWAKCFKNNTTKIIIIIPLFPHCFYLEGICKENHTHPIAA